MIMQQHSVSYTRKDTIHMNVCELDFSDGDKDPKPKQYVHTTTKQDIRATVTMRKLTKGLSITRVAKDMNTSWDVVKNVELLDKSEHKPRQQTIDRYIEAVDNFISGNTNSTTATEPVAVVTIDSDPIIDTALMAADSFSFDTVVNARKALGWTLVETAERAELSAATVSSLERKGLWHAHQKSAFSYVKAIISECRSRTGTANIAALRKAMSSKPKVHGHADSNKLDRQQILELMGMFQPKPRVMRRGRLKKLGNR